MKVMAKERPYHHGDLRAALLGAAEDELAERGVEGFTLRGCARRAGVSHAAPAHHFGDVTALLTAVATVAFERLSGSMREESAGVPSGSVDYLAAIGRGYVLFAVRNPEHFKLMFRFERLNGADPGLCAAADAAFQTLVAAVGDHRGVVDVMNDDATRQDVLAAWSLVHGCAGLILSGQLPAPEPMEATIRALVDPMVGQLFTPP